MSTLDNIYYVLPGLIAVSCIGAALAILGMVRMNKGAKINLAWILIAIGLALIGAAGAVTYAELAGERPIGWLLTPPLAALGAVLVLCGALYARSIFKRLLK